MKIRYTIYIEGGVEDRDLDYLVPPIEAIFRSIDWFIAALAVVASITLTHNQKVVPIRWKNSLIICTYV